MNQTDCDIRSKPAITRWIRSLIFKIVQSTILNNTSELSVSTEAIHGLVLTLTHPVLLIQKWRKRMIGYGQLKK